MKLLLYRFSLTEREQLDLVDPPSPSREEFFSDRFMTKIEFPSRGESKIYYWPIQKENNIIAGCFAKCSNAFIDVDQADPFAQTLGIHWEKSAFFLNFGDDEQVIAVESKPNVGRPYTLLNRLARNLNGNTSRNDFIVSVHSINSEEGFWTAIKSHKLKGGKITSLTFDMVVPNPDIANKTKDILGKIKAEYNAEKVKETISSPSGLQVENDSAKSREEYIRQGGGDVVAKEDGKTVYDSKSNQQRIEIDEDLRPDGKLKETGLIGKLSKVLRR